MQNPQISASKREKENKSILDISKHSLPSWSQHQSEQSLSLYISNSSSAEEQKTEDCRWHQQGNVSVRRTSGRLIQRMSFGWVTHMTCPHGASCPPDVLDPPLIFPSLQCVTHALQPRGTSPWPALLGGVFLWNNGRLFRLLDVIFLSLSFYFLFSINEVLPCEQRSLQPASKKSNQSVPWRWSARQRILNNSFVPLNWHPASTSFCQSNKLMLSGIDCLLLMVASFHATHLGN